MFLRSLLKPALAVLPILPNVFNENMATRLLNISPARKPDLQNDYSG